MSILAKIIIDDKEINVLWFSFSFYQGIDQHGRPRQKPLFNGLELVIETRRDVKMEYWAFAPNEAKQLELHIYPVIDGGRTRKLFFYDCHLVGWKNKFESTGSKPLNERLKISCGGFRDESADAEFSAPWRETFGVNDVEPTTINDEEPVIIEAYFEDNEGKRISKVRKRDTLFLVLRTQDMAGKQVDIDLGSSDMTFEYQGKILENNTLREFTLNSDAMKIELKPSNKNN